MGSQQQEQFNDVTSQLKPQILDQSRCTPLTSLTEQLKKASIKKAAIERQDKQFNMANEIYFDDPIKAAEYLRERDYVKTSVCGKPTVKQFNMGNGFYFDDPIKAAEYLLEREYKKSSVYGKPTVKQFNMANGIYLDDPIKAADYLLKREYGETSVFGKGTDNGPVFIPPAFLSDYHREENAILDYDIPERVKTMKENLLRDAPDEWFTEEFRRFVENGTELKNRDVFEWRRKMQLLDLVRKHGPKVDSARISNDDGTNKSITDIISECAKLVNGADPGHELSKKLFTFSEKQVNTEKWLTDLIKEFPLSSDSWALSWLYKLNENVSGEEAEQWVFDGLQKCVKQEDFVVLRGADIKLEADQREMDFLIFSGQRKIVIGLEVKNSYQKRTTAVGQLKKYYEFLEQRFGDIIGGWKFIPICCFYDQSTLPTDNIPQSKYVITGSTDMKAWWNSICREYPTSDPADKQAQTQLQDVLKLIVFTFHVGKTPMGGSGFVTPTKIVGEVSKAIETVSTASNILFYSKNQLQIMNGTCKNVLLTSSYGTGKTFLLFEKAKELAKRGEKVAFTFDESVIVCKLLTKQLGLQVELLKEHENITIFNNMIYHDEYCKALMPFHLLEYAESHPKSHIFVDEWRYSPNGKSVADFKPLLQAMKGRHFWVSLSIDTSHELQKKVGEDWKALDNMFKRKFYIPQLEYSMRSSAEIIRAAKALNHPNISITLPPYNFPQGLAPEEFSIHPSQKDNKKAVECVFRAAYDAARRRTDKCILVIVSGLYDPKVLVESAESVVPINEELSTYFVIDNYGTIFGDHVGFLRKNKGVLISDPLGCQGSEWDCVICFYGDDNPRAEPLQSLCNWYMRCISYLIIIKCEEKAKVLDLS